MTKRPRQRRTQQERREATKLKIMDASFEVMKKLGYSGFTMSEVSHAAKVSRGAILHHYPNKDSLILATFEYLHIKVQKFTQERATGLHGIDEIFDEMVADTIDFFFGDYFWTILEVSLAASKVSDLGKQSNAITKKYRIPTEEIWEAMLVKAGVDPETAGRIVLLTMNIVRGFAIHGRIQDDPRRMRQILKVWQDMVWSYWPKYAPKRR